MIGCILGNSHISMLKLGSQLTAEVQPTISYDFFGAPGALLSKADINGTILQTDDEELKQAFEMTGGKQSTNLADYDFICIAGCALKMDMTLRLLITHHWQLADGVQLASVNYLEAALEEFIRGTLAYKLAMQIYPINPVVFIVPAPNYSIGIRRRIGHALYSNPRILEIGDQADAMFRKVVDRAFNGLATVVHQPSDTIEDSIFTKREFNVGAVRLLEPETQRAKRDVTHTNGKYGALILEEIANRLQSALQGRQEQKWA